MHPAAIHVEYTAMPGKNVGLHFHGLPFAVYEALKGYISRSTGWKDEPDYEAFKRGSLFFQSDSYAAMQNGGCAIEKDDPESYLFLEFWSEGEKHAECAAKILARLRQMVPEEVVKVSGEQVIRLHQARRLLQEAYEEEGFEVVEMPPAILIRLADKLGQAAREPLEAALQVMLPALDMALAMGSISGPQPMVQDIERGRALARAALRPAPASEKRKSVSKC